MRKVDPDTAYARHSLGSSDLSSFGLVTGSLCITKPMTSPSD